MHGLLTSDSELDLPASADGKDGTGKDTSKSPCRRFFSSLLGLYDWSLFTNVLFLVYVTGVMLGNAGYMNATQLIPPHCKDVGISADNTANLVSVIGGCDLFGRVFGGWFADLNFFKRSNLMAGCIVVVGLTLIAYTFIGGYPGLLILCVVLGLLGGFYMSMLAVVCGDFVGNNKFPAAFSLTVLSMGISNTGLPMLLGECPVLFCIVYIGVSCTGLSVVLGGCLVLLCMGITSCVRVDVTAYIWKCVTERFHCKRNEAQSREYA